MESHYEFRTTPMQSFRLPLRDAPKDALERLIEAAQAVLHERNAEIVSENLESM